MNIYKIWLISALDLRIQRMKAFINDIMKKKLLMFIQNTLGAVHKSVRTKSQKIDSFPFPKMSALT